MKTRMMAVVAVVALTSIGAWPLFARGDASDAPRRAPDERVLERSAELARDELPGYAGLPPVERLKRALQLPGMRGVVFGTVVSDRGSSELPPSDPQAPSTARTVTDFGFKVHRTYGTDVELYPRDAEIALRVPGGRLGNAVTTVEYAPAPKVGQRLLVFMLDQPEGGRAGSSSSSVLAVRSEADIAVLDADGIVHWVGLDEPLNDYITHLGRVRK